MREDEHRFETLKRKKPDRKRANQTHGVEKQEMSKV